MQRTRNIHLSSVCLGTMRVEWVEGVKTREAREGTRDPQKKADAWGFVLMSPHKNKGQKESVLGGRGPTELRQYKTTTDFRDGQLREEPKKREGQ